MFALRLRYACVAVALPMHCACIVNFFAGTVVEGSINTPTKPNSVLNHQLWFPAIEASKVL